MSLLLACSADSVALTGGGGVQGDTSTEVASTSGDATTSETTTSAEPQRTSSIATSSTGAAQGWFELGWGVEEFNAFDEETLPIFLGTQGLEMFSVPIRGGGFPFQPEPSNIDHPDTPLQTLWLDIEGITLDRSEHFDEYAGYKVPFEEAIGKDGESIAEYVAVSLIIPEHIGGAALEGRQAYLHAELTCADGQTLVTDIEATIELEVPEQQQ